MALFGFTGELHHGDQVYLRARWYTPGWGTFPSRDPFAGFPEMPYSLHAYQYAYRNPVLWSDPTGEVPWLLLLGLLLAGGAAAASPAVAYAPPQGVDVAALPPSDTFDDGKAFLATAPGTGDINDVAIVLTGRDLFGEPQDRVLAALAACLPFLTVGALRSLGRVDTGRVLLIGEGDFSFARSVVEQGQSPPRTMVASSYENPPISGAASNTEVLQRRGVRVEPGLDARRLHERVDLGEFDLIVWNFPYQPSSRTDSTEVHQALLQSFFGSARSRLSSGGRVVVTLKNDFPYNTWKIEEQARSQGFRLVDTPAFNLADYPGYVPSQTKTNAPIPLDAGATHYVFERVR